MNTLLYITTVAIWGGTWIGIHYQVQNVDPLASLFYRFLIAAVVLLTFCLVTRRRLRFSAQDNLFVALQGVLLFSTNFWLLYLSARTLESGLVALLFSSVVIMNIVNGCLFLGHRVRVAEVAGALVGMAGLAIVLVPGLRRVGGASVDAPMLQAVAICLLGAYLASLGNIVSARNQKRGVPVMSANALAMAYACVVLLLIARTQGAAFTFDTSPAYVGSLLYLALLATVIGFWCYLTLLGRIGPQKASFTMMIFPVVAVAISAHFERLPVSANLLIGLALVLFGNFLVMAPPAWLARLSPMGDTRA
jgi:drug/metabolite transporter (DMT)-like permease